jgi:putative ABC transport system permease protein
MDRNRIRITPVVVRTFLPLVTGIGHPLLTALMDTLLQDLRYGARALRMNPGFAVVAILTLALGIGLSTAMFTLVNTVLLRPLEYREPERLVMIWERPPGEDVNANASPANFLAWRAQARSFTELAATVDQRLNLAGSGGAPEVVRTRLTTGNFFAVLGARPQLGRTYAAGDEAEQVAVLSHRLWQRRFGGDPAIVGKTVLVNTQPYTVVGVMRPDFRSAGLRPELWLPTELSETSSGRFLQVIGRLRPGATLAAAASEMRQITARRAIDFPDFSRGYSARVVPMHEEITGGVRTTLLVLLGAVGLLLVIACANVANLLLGRAAARRREIAVRLSIGATRGRLIRQTLTESLLLALVAGVVGLGLAVWGTQALVRLLPPDLALPRLDEVRVDGRILGFAMGLSLLTGMIFGVAPAVMGSAVNLASALRDAMRGTSGGGSRLRNALVMAEVAIAVVLLVGAGLVGRSLQRMLAVETGIRTEGLLTSRITLSSAQYEEDGQLRGFMGSLMPGLRETPGVIAAGAESYLPLSGETIGHEFWYADRPHPAGTDNPDTQFRIIAGDYFRAMGIPLLQGRVLTDRDNETAAQVFVVNREFARRYFPGESPVGRRISYEWGDTTTGEIVGVVGDIREMGPAQEPSPALYRPYAQMPMYQMALVVRTAGEPASMASAVAAAVRRIDPNQPLADLRSMEQVASDLVARPRLNLYLLGGFALAALLLAALGLYGIIAYSVTQRRQEIGVRVALGAQPRDVLRMVVSQGMKLTGWGLLIGIAAALVVTRVMTSLLFGVGTSDPVTLVGVSLFLGLVAAVSSYIPARRAAQVDSMVALRAD